LRADLDWSDTLSRDQFEELLSAAVRAGILGAENAEFEKDGQVIPYRRISLTREGLEVRPTTPLDLLIGDGIVEQFSGDADSPKRDRKKKERRSLGSAQPEPPPLSPEAEVLAGRLRQWRSDEAKRLRVPAYVVLHDRTLTRIAARRPVNPNQLLSIEGMGETKVEKFGAAILELCAAL
jgi:superfamily II DNA helicase RecQ